MIKIEEITYDLFFYEKKKFKYILGKTPEYNSEFYRVFITYEGCEILVGLQTMNFGIKPQIELYNDKLLICAGLSFLVYSLEGVLLKEHTVRTPLYEFIIKEHKILIISELDVFLLNITFDIIWEKFFNEIIWLKEIKENVIILRDYEDRIIKLDFATGSDMKKSS